MNIEPRALDHPDARVLVEAIQDYYVELYGGVDRDLTDPAQFAPPSGTFLVGYLDEVPVACGGWRRHDEQIAEIKRMYVEPARRGRGLARELLAALEQRAADAGVEQITLNTGFRQVEAIGFYESCGYRRTDRRFGHYERIEGAHFFVKQL